MNDLSPHRTYDPSVLEPARQMVANGATVCELADRFGVPPASVELWAACHDEFAAALKVARAMADDRVERSWYNRCVGYTYDSEKVQYDAGTETRPGDGWIRTPTREHVPPDAAACAAWLRNRRPEQWNEKYNLDVRGTIEHRADEGPVLDASCSPDEIQREYAEALAAAAQRKLLASPAPGGSR
jgi:hypothetical protein